MSYQARAGVRIAASPLMETVAAVRMMANRDTVPFLYRSWSEWAITYATDPKINWLLGWARSWDALCALPLPAPRVEDANFETELARLRDRLDHESPAESADIQSVADSATAVCDALELFWSCAIAPAWSRILATTEEDIFFRAKILARCGTDGLLADLHRRIRWRDPILVVDGVDSDNVRSGPVDELVLVPLIFCADKPFLRRAVEGPLMLCYQSRGIATLLDKGEATCREIQETTSCLEKLVGTAKAQILVAVQVPMTTTSLAVRLALAPSTISKHVHGLCASGLVDRRRVGKSVYYGLSDRGSALVDAMH